MKNSNLPRVSITVPPDSKSYINFDGKSINISEGDEPIDYIPDVNFNENFHIQKWMECRAKLNKKYITQSAIEAANNNFYMIQIDNVLEISYRKKMTGSRHNKEKERTNMQGSFYKKSDEDSNKMYLKIIANFYNAEILDYSSRTVEFNIVQLEHKTGLIYKVSEPNLALFFHSRHTSQSKYKVRIQLVVLESITVDTYQIVESEEYLGYCDIDPFKGLKTPQKVQVYSAKIGANVETCIQYTVLMSDAFKLLEKLIPPNCLISSEESIAGIAGRKLPNSIQRLHSQIQYTELYSMRVDIVAVDIPDAILNSKLREAEQLIKHFENVSNVAATLKQVKLNVMFHNGWTVFSESQAKLAQRMEIQKKNSKKSINQVIKIRHYTAQNVCALPFIFLDEEAIVVLQVMGKIQIKKKTGDLQNSSSGTSIIVPLCYSYYAIDKISVDEKQNKILLIGDGLNDFNMNRKFDYSGKLQFYVYIEHANKLQLSKHIVAANISANRSQTEADRILLEKQRIIRQNKKLKHQNRIKKIQLNQEIPLLDTTAFKQNLYKTQIQKLRQERKQKEELLEYLKAKVKEMAPSLTQSKIEEQSQSDMAPKKGFHNPAFAKNFHNSIFYQAALDKTLENTQKNQLIFNLDAFKVRPFSIMASQASANLYQSGQVPLQIIKTEMLEKNYCYAIFINWISLIPVNEDEKLPRKFRFETNFFKNTNLRSCSCQINELTGEIQVIQDPAKNKQVQKENDSKVKQSQNRKAKNKTTEQQQNTQNKERTQKIFYVEIGPDSKAKNNDNNFVELISYLYHSELQIKVIDQISEIQFGECFFNLKDLIRMRRNECTSLKDIWVSRVGRAKAKLRVQIRAIRKQPGNYKKQRPSNVQQLQTLAMQPEARQLQRILQYKKQKQGNQSTSINKVDKVINQQLTEEQITVNVSRMQGQFFKINVINRKNHTESYKVTISDPDKPFLVNEQIIVVNQILLNKIVNMAWWRYLHELDLIQSNNIIVADERNCFDLNAGQSGAILLYYYSERKYQGDYQRQAQSNLSEVLQRNKLESTHQSFNQHINKKTGSDNSKIFRVFNHSRCIDLTLSNTSNNALHSIYKINIVSQPDSSTINYKIVRKNNSKLLIEVPFNPHQNHVLYIDDPTAVSHLNENEGYVTLDCFIGKEGETKKINASILSPFPQNRLLINYCFQLFGAHEIYIQGQLWQPQQVLIDLHSSICLKKGLQYILALSEDQNSISIRDKNPIKVNQKQSKTMIRLNVTPSDVGIKHYELNILSPHDNSIIYRYSLKLEVQQPQINERITLRIRITDKMLEQPFGFKNDLPKKQKLRIISTRPHILWSPQDTIEVDARSDKKFKIKINAQEITQTQNVILGLMGGKKIYYYLFVLELDSQF